jgi:hypothetical protein
MSQFDSGYNVNPSKNKSPLTAFKSRTSMQSQRYGGYAQSFLYSKVETSTGLARQSSRHYHQLETCNKFSPLTVDSRPSGTARLGL